MVNKAAGSSSDKKAMALYRSDIYRLLARVYREEPDLDLIRWAKDQSFREILDEMEIRFEDDFLDVPDEALIEILGLEFTRLFIGPGKHISPHESVHHEIDGGGWGNLWGLSTAEVNNFMKSAGLELNQQEGLLPDHISAELEFMATVNKMEAQTRGKNDYEGTLYLLDMEKKFLKWHLAKWTPIFCDKVICETQSSFYRAMATVLKEFVELDENRVDSVITSVSSE